MSILTGSTKSQRCNDMKKLRKLELKDPLFESQTTQGWPSFRSVTVGLHDVMISSQYVTCCYTYHMCGKRPHTHMRQGQSKNINCPLFKHEKILH